MNTNMNPILIDGMIVYEEEADGVHIVPANIWSKNGKSTDHLISFTTGSKKEDVLLLSKLCEGTLVFGDVFNLCNFLEKN